MDHTKTPSVLQRLHFKNRAIGMRAAALRGAIEVAVHVHDELAVRIGSVRAFRPRAKILQDVLGVFGLILVWDELEDEPFVVFAAKFRGSVEIARLVHQQAASWRLAVTAIGFRAK